VLPDKKMQMLGSTKENKKLSNLFKQTHKNEFSRNIMKMIYLLKVDGSSYILLRSIAKSKKKKNEVTSF